MKDGNEKDTTVTYLLILYPLENHFLLYYNLFINDLASFLLTAMPITLLKVFSAVSLAAQKR